MSSKSNTVFLNQIFDEAVNFISDALSNPPVVLTSSYSPPQSINYCKTIGDTNSIGNCTITTTSGASTTVGSTVGYYNNIPFYGYNTILPFIYQPIIWVDALKDFTPSCSKKDIPSYPVSNYFITNDGDHVVEIAVSGFSKEEITVERKDLSIFVKGMREAPPEDKKEKPSKYFYRNLACRDFELEFKFYESCDFDKLEVSMDKGILTIKIPLKEEFQPVRKKYEIK
jgi:HSP20 family molecular chaperone IbpA